MPKSRGYEFELPRILSQSETYKSEVMSIIRAMEGRLPKGHDLHVYCWTGSEQIRVHQFQFGDSPLIAAHGEDSEGRFSSVISPASSLQLTCKVVKLAPEAKPKKIGFDVKNN